MPMLTRSSIILPSFPLIAAMALFGATLDTGNAHAQDESGDEEQDFDGEGEVETAPALTDMDKVRHGIGLRLRYIFVPKALIELFMEEAPSGVSQTGIGFDYVRRKKNFEFSVGFEYDKLAPDDGFFVERGGDPRQLGTTDEIRFDGLSWFTIDASIVYHHPLTSLISLRYGGGLGFGIVTGDIISKDAVCGGDDIQGGDCISGGPETKEDFFRFPPVFNVVGGVQITPADNFAINVELGMRTVFYSGVSGQYFF